MGKDRKDQTSEQPVAETALCVALDLWPCGFQERIVLHTRRAGRDARHAAEARVDVTNEALAAGFATVAAQFHQVNAPAGRVRLLPPQQIRGAGRQTKAAVDAIVKKVPAVETLRVRVHE